MKKEWFLTERNVKSFECTAEVKSNILVFFFCCFFALLTLKMSRNECDQAEVFCVF